MVHMLTILQQHRAQQQGEGLGGGTHLSEIKGNSDYPSL